MCNSLPWWFVLLTLPSLKDDKSFQTNMTPVSRVSMFESAVEVGNAFTHVHCSVLCLCIAVLVTCDRRTLPTPKVWLLMGLRSSLERG